MEMGTAAIRRYREYDAARVGQLIADTFSEFNLAGVSPEQRAAFLGPFRYAGSPEQAHREAIARVIRAPLVFVAEEGGEIVGVLRGGRRDQAQRTVLQSLFVRGDHHRRGIGRQLVECFEQECLRRGATVIRVAATPYAVPFYVKMGYKRTTGVRSVICFDGSGLEVQPMRKVFDVQ
jgi:GNAT superfamily N-acetyltransferase